MKNNERLSLIKDLPAARRTDPPASHRAGHEISKSGQRVTQAQRIYALLCENPGSTRGEIADIIKKQDGTEAEVFCMVSRRVADLVNIGSVKHGEERVCSIRHRIIGTLWPIQNPEEISPIKKRTKYDLLKDKLKEKNELIKRLRKRIKKLKQKTRSTRT